MPSPANLAAILLYLATAALCCTAWRAAAKAGRPIREVPNWILCATFFVILVAIRLFRIEEGVRSALRQALRDGGVWGQRGELQFVLVAIVLALILAAVLLAMRQAERTGRSRGRKLLLLANTALSGFAILFALRIVSLHAVDQVLYRGPVPLNWLLDGALTLAVSWSAFIYVRLYRAPSVRRR